MEIVKLEVAGVDEIDGPGFAPLLEKMRLKKSVGEASLWMERKEAANLIDAKRERIDHALSSYARKKSHLPPAQEDEKYFIQSKKVDQWWARAVSKSYEKKDLLAAFALGRPENDGYEGLRSAWRSRVFGSGLLAELLSLSGLFCAWMGIGMMARKARDRMAWASSQMISEAERGEIEQESRPSEKRGPSKRL